MDEMLNQITACMAISQAGMSDIQKVQTEHRLKLASFWSIKENSRILEIGCGQGDTTAVLAYLVGENGFVHGVDRGATDYGAPITVGEAAQILMNSKLGNRIQMEYDIDLLNPEIDFPENSFDMVVLSHCSWYFQSAEQLSAIFKRARKWGKQLVFAEWDSRIDSMDQYPHLLATLIQAQYECYKQESSSNIRTLFTPQDVQVLAEQAGWTITSETSIHSPELQDGVWEINKTLAETQSELDGITHLPAKLKSLIQSEVQLLEASIQNREIKPMATYAFVAR